MSSRLARLPAGRRTKWLVLIAWLALKAIDDVHKTVERGPPAGLDVRVTGPAGGLADLVKVFGSIDGTLLLVTLAVVIVMLLLTYRSPFLWLVPLISAGSAYLLSQGVVYLLAKTPSSARGPSPGTSRPAPAARPW